MYQGLELGSFNVKSVHKMHIFTNYLTRNVKKHCKICLNEQIPTLLSKGTGAKTKSFKMNQEQL